MFTVAFAQIVNSPTEATPLFRLGEIFLRVLSALIPVGGIILFVMLLIGGFSYLTAGGDPRRAEGARNTITYAIGGIVLLAAAFLIIQIISSFIGVPAILNFNLYQG